MHYSFAAVFLLSILSIIIVSATNLNDYNVRPVCTAGDDIRRLSNVETGTSIQEIQWNKQHNRRIATNGTNNKIVNFTTGTTEMDGGSNCNPPCLGDFLEFCGKDGQCHASTCENIYQYGNSSFTGVLNDNPPNLTCTIIDPATTDMDSVPVAVSYSCVGYTCTDSLGFDDASRKNVIHMNQYCHAQPLDDFAFLCYELIPQNDTDLFTDFIANTNGSTTGYGCDEQWVDPQDSVPQYLYNRAYGFWRSPYYGESNCTNATAFLCDLGGYTAYGGQNSSDFNQSIAYSSFYAQLSYIFPPTESPTGTRSPAPSISPTFPTPTSSASNHLLFHISANPELLVLFLGFLLF